MKFQCWKSEDGCSITFAQIESIAYQLAHGLLEEDAELQYEIEAETYNQAMQEHYNRQGWGTYRPILEDS